MTDLTLLLKKSIAFEKSKTDLTNLLNHSEPNLLLMIDAIEHQMREYQEEINIRERCINEAEDMSERVRANLDEAITWRKDRIQSLIAWRLIYFTAIDEIK